VPPRLPGLQLLRALAAVMVLIGHTLSEGGHYMALPLRHENLPWTRGVDIFFVISGFIVTLSAARFEGQPLSFLWRRFLRVTPLYYLFTTLMVIVVLVLPQGAKDTGFEPGQILASYLFLPWAREDGRIAPVLSLGWTLNYEMFFYLLFAAALLAGRALATLAGVIAALVAIGIIWSSAPVAVTFWTNPLMLEFALGMVLARLWQRGYVRADGFLALGAVIGGLALMVALHCAALPRVIAAGLPAMLIVAGGTLFCPAPGCMRWPGQILGDASFALYLSHRFVLRTLTLLLLPLLPVNFFGVFVYVAVTSLVALGAAILVHLWIERPMLTALDGPRRTVPT
jgi:exopolysaccharide production protein ExoZ